MPLLVPNTSESDMLEIIVGKRTQENLVVRLFSNNATPGETDTAAAYTEVTGNGYASQPCVPANWTTTPGNPTEIAHPEVTFAFTGAAGNVFGYYLTGATSGRLYWAERFTGAPIAIANAGEQIRIVPRFTLE